MNKKSLPETGNKIRLRTSFDFGWKFFKGDISGGQLLECADAGWRTWICRMTGASRAFNPQRGSETSAHLHPVSAVRKHFHVPRAYATKTVVIELTVFTRIAKYGSMVIPWQRPYGYVGFLLYLVHT